MLAVTAIDEKYFPGLVALHNSMLRNSPNVELACIVYGSEEVAGMVGRRGIRVLHNPEFNANMPTTDIYPVGNPAMYCRLMLPHWYAQDAVWLDADQVVLKPLDPLFAMTCDGLPCAAVPAGDISSQVIGMDGNNGRAALYAGLLLMKRAEWLSQRVTERCFEVMNTSGLTFKYVVQSVLSYVLNGGFKRLHPMWQRFGNRTHEQLPADACVVHWHGHSRNPWICTMANQNLWQEYA